MDKLIKKIKVASVSGIVTILICITQSVSSYASDTELYRPPQNKELTLMFMLDVSGSMSPSGNSYGENRLQSLKNGMLKLLQGDSSDGTQPLPDDLVTGLSEFSGTTGRIKLEARSLGEKISIGGAKEVYRTIQTIEQNANRTVTSSRITSFSQNRTQYGTRTQSCWFIFCSWDEPGNWTPSDSSNTGWVNQSSSSGTWTSDNPSWSLSGNPSATATTNQECRAWATNNTSCTLWINTSTPLSSFNTSTSVTSNTSFSYSNIRSGSESPISSSSPVTSGITNSNPSCSGSNCSRTQSRTQSTTEIKTTPQNATASYTSTVTYSGANTITHRERMINAVNALTAGGGTPTAFAYAEVAAYLMGQTTKNVVNSGFTASSEGAIRNTNNYIKPEQIDSSKTCNGQGIYFLTDGVPEYGRSNSSLDIMRTSLGTSGSDFSCKADSLGWRTPYYNSSNNTNNWTCIGEYTKAILNKDLNPTGTSILTAVVGFGSDMSADRPSSSVANDIADAKAWGELGEGGFYKGNNAQSIVDSVSDFINKLDRYIPGVTVGSATIPVDALDTQNVQPWAYFPQFDPKPTNSSTGALTWIGNVKKYKTLNNNLLDRGNEIITDNNGLLKDDLNDYWADTSVTKTITKEVNGNKISFKVKVGGALSQLPVGYNANNTPIERRIFTDRTIQVSSTDSTTNQIGSISSGNLKKIGRNDFISSSVNQFKEDPKRGYILSLLGYNVSRELASSINSLPKNDTNQTQLERLVSSNSALLRQMGAVMHSRPILLTQQGTTKYENEVLSYDDRDDLILFGTTQGLLHIVKAGKTATDTDAGKELFTFVPNEMIENQAEAFLNQESQSGTLQYGIDGQWTAYTEYVTQKGSNSTDEPVVTVKGGKQWVYGGLRMGGRSYYALDLTDISSTDNNSVPKLKFRINPSATSSGPLSYMGQSWSKPNITWVNWKGKRKLVMFVGGGYDMGYEADVYNQINGVGAGVYMFDADNGDLLWWASSNLAADVNSENSPNALKVDDMKYSVVSQIKTVDRNNDGLVDHLYFGDLGGQVWRVDLNNTKTLTDAFAKRAVKILNLNKTNGSSPRFYTTPSFTIHNGGASGLFATISLGSGDLSSPMSAESSSGKDNIYVIFDKDVTKANLYQLTDNQLITRNIVIGSSGNTLAVNTDGNTKTTLARAGWYYPLANKLRVLNDTVAIAGDLYVSVFDSSKDLDALSCSGGVRGESNVEQFCLPYGQCSEIKNGSEVIGTRLKDVTLGKGNIGIAFGGSTGTPSPDRTLILNVSKPVGKVLPNYPGKLKLVSQRWYEKYAKAR